MDTKIRVREAMTPSVIVIKPTTPVNEAAKIMSEKNIGSVVVSEGSKPIGIIT
jgi:acetoin utilization protein AcuB